MRRRLRVIASVPAPRPQDNPFAQIIYDALPKDIDVRWFTWQGALLGSWDVLHVHWPEFLFRSSKPGISTVLKGGLAWLLLVRVAATRRPIVWTVHNQVPHESSGFIERRWHKCFRRLVTVRVYFTAEESERFEGALVRHPHYCGVIPHTTPEGVVTDRLVFAGFIRPYKGVEQMIEAFKHVPMAALSLVIMGKPCDPEYGDQIVRLCDSDRRILIELGFLSDADLARVLSGSGLVILPYLEEGNSGMAMMALSCGRPILTRYSSFSRELQNCVGSEWVHLFAGELDSHDICGAIGGLPGAGESPDLGKFAPAEAGSRYASVFREAALLSVRGHRAARVGVEP